jgi:hypothetical protein
MKKLAVFLVVVFLPNLAQTTMLQKGPVTIEGYIQNETGLFMGEMDEFSKVLNIIDLRAQYKPTDYFSVFGHIHKYWDHAYNIEDDPDRQAARYAMYTNRRTWTGISWVRELYADFYSEYLDGRLGKQIVTWGTTDGIRILDKYVNPLDWREFSLKPWNDIKVPLWMVKLEFAPTLNGTLQFLVIPDFEPDYWPAVGAPYAIGTSEKGAHLLAPLRQAGFNVIERDNSPAENFDNAKYGVRWRDVIGGFEYSLNYIYSWATESPERLTIIDPFNKRAISEIIYHRVHVFGGSFANTFTSNFLKGLTLRGEFTYVKDEPKCYLKSDGTFGWEETDLYNYAIGLDKYVTTNWLVSFQFIQLISSKGNVDGQPFVWPSAGPMDKVETMLTLNVSTDFFHERLKPSILIVYGDDNDWRISPEAYLEISDHINTTLGMHIFAGNQGGLHGQFNNENQVYLTMRYSF